MRQVQTNRIVGRCGLENRKGAAIRLKGLMLNSRVKPRLGELWTISACCLPSFGSDLLNWIGRLANFAGRELKFGCKISLCRSFKFCWNNPAKSSPALSCNVESGLRVRLLTSIMA